MKEILVSQGKTTDLPVCWGKFCNHCTGIMWKDGNSIDEVIRSELKSFNAELVDDGPGLGYRVLFPNDRDYFWFSIIFS